MDKGHLNEVGVGKLEIVPHIINLPYIVFCAIGISLLQCMSVSSEFNYFNICPDPVREVHSTRMHTLTRIRRFRVPFALCKFK